jgi:hypothetical protein
MDGVLVTAPRAGRRIADGALARDVAAPTAARLARAPVVLDGWVVKTVTAARLLLRNPPAKEQNTNAVRAAARAAPPNGRWGTRPARLMRAWASRPCRPNARLFPCSAPAAHCGHGHAATAAGERGNAAAQAWPWGSRAAQQTRGGRPPNLPLPLPLPALARKSYAPIAGRGEARLAKRRLVRALRIHLR